MTLIAASALAACSPEDLIRTGFEYSEVHDHGSHIKSHFRILSTYPVDTVLNTTARFIQTDGSFVGDFQAVVNIEASSSYSEVELTLDDRSAVPDGHYILKFDVLEDRFTVRAASAKISEGEICNGSYSDLRNFGNGTKESPFIISNTKFNIFLKCLKDDPYHGAGYYFQQNQKVNWKIDETTAGTGYTPYPFAGSYDGGSNELWDISANSMDSIGMFSKLMNGAEIKNLKLKNLSFIYCKKNVGAIAGSSENTVTISNVTIDGTITAEQNAGGVIGKASGNISLSDVTLGMSVMANENVGGIIGLCDTCKVNVSAVTASAMTDPFSVGGESAKAVGGIIGRFNHGSFTISDVILDHSAIKEESGVKVVFGKENVGGIVGHISGQSSDCAILSSRVLVPIHVSECGGGFIGRASVGKPLEIDGSIFSGSIAGSSEIGGFAGHMQGSDSSSPITFSNNAYANDSNGDVYINGGETVGGYFGYLKECTISFSGSNYLMASVTGTDHVGGVAGFIEGSTIALGTSLYTSDSAEGATGIHIQGTAKTGGLVGYMKASAISGTQDLSPKSSLPAFNTDRITVIANVMGNGNGVGGAVGWSENSYVQGISVKATINNESHIYTGGVVGYAIFGDDKPQIADCSFSGIIDGKEYVGGIVGEIAHKGQVKQCINYGTVSSENGGPVGGIVGKVNYDADEPYVTECANLGTVSGKGDVGGIVGFMSSTKSHDWCKVNECGNYGNVEGDPSSDRSGIGGIVGKSNTKKVRISHCANHGEVTGNGHFRGVGGIAGCLGLDDLATTHENLDIYECANFGKVHSTHADSHVGGIIGYQEEGDVQKNGSKVHQCYNCGEITSEQNDDNGGIVGYADYSTTIEYCINYGKVHHGNAMIGTRTFGADLYTSHLYYLEDTGKDWMSDKSFTSSQQGSQDTYSEFDFTDTWTMSDGKAILKRCPFQNLSAPK